MSRNERQRSWRGLRKQRTARKGMRRTGRVFSNQSSYVSSALSLFIYLSQFPWRWYALSLWFQAPSYYTVFPCRRALLYAELTSVVSTYCSTDNYITFEWTSSSLLHSFFPNILLQRDRKQPLCHSFKWLKLYHIANGEWYVKFGISKVVTMKNVVFWDINSQVVPHRQHITSPLQSPAI
jgi:hypothetical protein